MIQCVFLLGASGHAKMIIEVLRSQPTSYKIIACLDKSPKVDNLLGVKVIEETAEILSRFAQDRVHGLVAIGDNRQRSKLIKTLDSSGIQQAVAISKNAIVSASASIGPGTVVMPGAVIGASTVVGRGCIINTLSSIDHDGSIGDFVHVCPGCHVAGSVRIGEGVFLGTGSSVIDYIEIESWAIVGAGSTVIRNLAGAQTYVGSPAKSL